VCVCVRCTFIKKTNHNFSLPEIKKESERVHEQFFITISPIRTMTYFFGTQLFFGGDICIHLYALCWVTRSTYVSEQQMIVS